MSAGVYATSGRGNEPKDRIILALDVPTASEALAIVHEFGELISFYKVGLELLMAGDMADLLRQLVQGKRVFVDLKLPNDIPTTVERVVGLAARLDATFLTLSHSATAGTIESALKGRGDRPYPKLLYVPVLSSSDSEDFAQKYDREPSEFEAFLIEKADKALSYGVDGFIVSGQEIGLVRRRHPEALIVSPGIRPAGSAADDHKRSCTPEEAIKLGADYLVIGRPLRNAPDRRGSAERVIDEIARATGGQGAVGISPDDEGKRPHGLAPAGLGRTG